MRTKVEAYRLGEGDSDIGCWNEHIYCDKCGKEIEEFEVNEGDNTELCPDCYIEECGYDESLTLENALKYGEETQSKIEINDFWDFIFTSYDIQLMFEREWSEMPEEMRIDLLNQYAKDRVGIAEWAKEIMKIDVND